MLRNHSRKDTVILVFSFMVNVGVILRRPTGLIFMANQETARDLVTKIAMTKTTTSVLELVARTMFIG